MKRVCLLIESLHTAGGAERVLTTMANHWTAQGIDVTICSFDPPSDREPFYAPDPGVKWRPIGLGPYRVSRQRLGWIPSHFMKRVVVLRRLWKKDPPDTVIAFMDVTNLTALFASFFLKVPVIISERNNFLLKRLPLRWRIMRIFFYPLCKALVLQTRAQRDSLPPRLRKKAVVIPNPVMALPSSDATRQFHKPFVLGVGRLRVQKGFDLLIKAFKQASDSFRDWSLVILGEGEERRNLEALAASLGLEDRVLFPGTVANPFSVYNACDLFVLSSRFEGFPNALTEAMMCKAAVIATNCDFGPADIIEDGKNGILVAPESIPELVRAMTRLMQDAALRKSLGEQAPSIEERFSLDSVMAAWERLCLA